jgi:hypothetical protein
MENRNGLVAGTYCRPTVFAHHASVTQAAPRAGDKTYAVPCNRRAPRKMSSYEGTSFLESVNRCSAAGPRRSKD